MKMKKIMTKKKEKLVINNVLKIIMKKKLKFNKKIKNH